MVGVGEAGLLPRSPQTILLVEDQGVAEARGEGGGTNMSGRGATQVQGSILGTCRTDEMMDQTGIKTMSSTGADLCNIPLADLLDVAMGAAEGCETFCRSTARVGHLPPRRRGQISRFWSRSSSMSSLRGNLRICTFTGIFAHGTWRETSARRTCLPTKLMRG